MTPLGADNLPAQPERTKSNGMAWLFILLVMLIFSSTMMLPHYGKGWVRHITTRVSLTQLPTSSKPVAAATALTSSASRERVPKLGSGSVEKQPERQQDGASDGKAVAGLEREEGPQEEAQEQQQQKQEEGPPQQQPEQQQEEAEPASETAKEQADTPEPVSEDSAAAKAKLESLPADDAQPEAEGSAADEAKDTQPDAHRSAVDEAKDEGVPSADEQDAPGGPKDEDEDEEAKRKAAELQAHEERYQAALEEARSTPRGTLIDRVVYIYILYIYRHIMLHV